jgi:8-oxo-dGTP pyrophosphatase MutT (NUDIX family)
MTDAVLRQPHRIVAGILIRGSKVLLCHRSTSREWYPGVWDLPGGHVEAGEIASAAVVRELEEELDVVIPEPKGKCLERISTGDFDMRVWLVTEWRGTPVNAATDEHDEIRWFAASDASALDLAHESYARLISHAFSVASRPDELHGGGPLSPR